MVCIRKGGVCSAGPITSAVLTLLLVAGTAAGGTVWSIGRADEARPYAEFAIAGKSEEFAARFPNDPVFVIGQSKPETDWPYIHPGPADGWAGSRNHAFRIQFDLADPGREAYRLTLHAANAHSGGPPQVQVKVNDTYQRTLAFQPGADDRALTDPSIGRRQAQSVLFPASCLRQGRNEIALTSVAGSWLLYDAVVLETTNVKGAEIEAVGASCTPLFAGSANDLKQAVRVTVKNTGIEGQAVIELADAPGSAKEVRLEQGVGIFFLLVAPFAQPAQQRVLVRLGDKTSDAAFEGRPERHWTIYVAPSTHTDIGYTDLQEKIFARHNDNTAAALKACETSPGFKWNLEVFAQDDWYRQRGDQAFEQLTRRIKEGRVGLTGLCLNMLTGICSGDEMVRVLEPTQDFGHANGVPVTVATLTDVPTMVGTLPMLLRQAGVKYFVDGINHDRGPVWFHADKRMVQSPFWWEGLDGSRVLAVFTRSYGQAQVIGLRDSVAVLQDRLPGWLKEIDRPDYPCDAVYGNGAFWDNESVTPHFIEVADEWNKTWAYPHIIVARADEFFQYVEQNFGQALPVFKGDMGAYWEDGAASSALETGMVRLAKPRLNVAERWNALAALFDAKWAIPKADFAQAWKDAIYYDEHTWGAAGSISDPQGEQTKQQWAYKAAYAQRAAEKSVDLYLHSGQAAFEKLSGSKSQDAGRGRHVVVSNECSWPRDIPVAVPASGSDVTVRDLARGCDAPSFRQGDYAFFVAAAVPAMGYRCYTIEPLEASKAAAAEVKPLLRKGNDPYTWDSANFRYRIDPKTGAFYSIEDLRTHREWVDASTGYAVNEFLYVTGGNGTSLVHPGATPAPPLLPVSHTEAAVRLVANAPFCAVLAISRKGAGVSPVETYCTIHDDGRLDFVNVMDKQETTEKEAGYFAFPFRLDAPEHTRTLLDLPYGIVEADREQLPGACREWFAANSFMAVSDDRAAAYVATREAPLFTVGVLNRGAWPAKLDNNRGLVFGYAFNNYWHTNYKASQGGRLCFAYSVKLSEAAFDPVTATRFGWETLASDSVENVLCRCVARGQAAHADEGAFVRMDDGPVMLAELTQDDNGRMLARLYNPSSAAATSTVEFPKLRIKNVWKTDLFGRQGESIPIETSRRALKAAVPARSIMTLAIEIAR